MRVLKYVVDGLELKQNETCNFDGIVAGSQEGFVQLEFSFSSEWNDRVKVAAFYSMMGREYPPQVLEDGKTCMVPVEALQRRYYQLKVIGKNDKSKIETNKILVSQNGGRSIK